MFYGYDRFAFSVSQESQTGSNYNFGAVAKKFKNLNQDSMAEDEKNKSESSLTWLNLKELSKLTADVLNDDLEQFTSSQIKQKTETLFGSSVDNLEFMEFYKIIGQDENRSKFSNLLKFNENLVNFEDKKRSLIDMEDEIDSKRVRFDSSFNQEEDKVSMGSKMGFEFSSSCTRNFFQRG